MNTFELLWNNLELTKSVQKQIANALSSKTGVTIIPSEPEFFKSNQQLNFSNWGMYRLIGPKQSGCLIFGFSNPDSKKTFDEVLKPPGNSSFDVKPVETHVLQSILTVLEPGLIEKKIEYNPKGSVTVNSAGMAMWSNLQHNLSIKLPFSANGKNFVMEMPAIDQAYREQLVKNYFGFSEASKILIVDDSLTTRKLSKHYFNGYGYLNIDDSVDGAQALEKIKQASPKFDLIVCDWHMPNLSGFDLLKKIRSTEATKDLPFILVTGERNKEEVTNAIKAAVSGYVVKPFDQLALFTAIKKAFDVYQKKIALNTKQAA